MYVKISKQYRILELNKLNIISCSDVEEGEEMGVCIYM